MTRRDLFSLAACSSSLLLQTSCAGGLETAGEAGSGGALPPFRAKTLDGKTFDNASVKGKVVLLQFWATWCGYCRREQPAVDRLTKEFENQGLIVLAVNVGESRDKVVDYLREKPRACNIVLSQDTNLVKLFPAEGFPKYVVINREGNIGGNQDGAGGIMALRDLLGGVGLRGAA